MGNLMSRTELEGSECNHGSGCGRSGSSASKLGTCRTLSLNSYKKYSRSTFFFNLFVLQVIQVKAKDWRTAGAFPPPTHTFPGCLGDCKGSEGSASLFFADMCVMTFVTSYPSLC